jgi:glycosyltransferase involved in cell wall biosynthesis
MDGLTTIIIPSRNEKYLHQTIKDLLEKATGQIEVIAILDGYWPIPSEISSDPRVNYIHLPVAKGMRNAINSAVSIANGEYILKTDAHCLFSSGYDEVLKKNCEYDWVVVPRRYALDPDKWEIEKRTDNKYPIDYMYLSKELHAVPWTERNNDPKLKEIMIDDLMSAQGSCWFMKKSYYQYLELEDIEHYGSFASEFQEIGFKTWLSGGKVKVNKNVWYAHWHKTEGRGYSLGNEDFKIAEDYVKRWVNEKMWRKQRKPFKSMIERFAPVPTWS